MTSSTGDLLTTLCRRGHEPMLGKVTGAVRFDITRGSDVDQWLVTVDNGNLWTGPASPGGPGSVDADCVIRVDGALFDRLASGEDNAMAALLRGALVVEGDPELLVLIQRLFPAPPAAGDRPPTEGDRT